MIYILTGSLLILFFISYFLNGRDFFAPMTAQALSFVFAGLMCIYFMKSFEAPYQFHLDSIAIIISSIAISVGIGIFAHQMFLRVKIRPYMQSEIAVSPILNGESVCILAFIVLAIVWQILEVRRIGGISGSFFENMFSFHAKRYRDVTGEYDLPFLLRQFGSLLNAIFAIYSFALIRFYKKMSFPRKMIHILVIGLCLLYGLLGGGRSGMINKFIACAMMFHLLRIQKNNGYRKYSFHFLFRVFVMFCLVLWAFAMLKTFVGRAQQSMSSPVDYISYYTGTEFISFDMYLRNPPRPSNIFGKETFYGLNQNLHNLGFQTIPRYEIHLEFRSIGGGQVTNVYTLFRSYHYDFGFIGIYVLHIVASIIMSTFYEYTKKKHDNISLLVFSTMYYSIVLSFFAERFFSYIVTIGFLKELILTLILYEILIRKRVRFIVGNKSTRVMASYTKIKLNSSLQIDFK